MATGVTSVVTSVTTAGGRPGWLPNNLNQGRLDLYYTALVLLSAVNVLFFLVVAHFYQYKQVRLCIAGPPPRCSRHCHTICEGIYIAYCMPSIMFA